MLYTTALIDRFWAKVAKCAHGDACTECCWEWQAAGARGYGTFVIYNAQGSDGTKHPKMMRANRLCWELVHGAIPPGLWVLHDCPHGDNPACVNPAHLCLGPPDDNQTDSMRKGRRPTGDQHGLRIHPEAVRRGENNHYARLTNEDVYAIREYGR